MVLVYLLWAIFGLFLKNHAYKREMFYRRNEHHQNMLPENADVNLIAFSNASLAECSKQCLLGGANCLGVFHNKEIQSCKLMSDNLVEGLSFQLQTGWEFFSVNRKYLIIFCCLRILFSFTNSFLHKSSFTYTEPMF